MPIELQQAKELMELIDEVIWQFGSQSTEGYCCEDISYVEYRALWMLARNESCTMQTLGQLLHFTKSGATRIVDRLENAGYAQRMRSEIDRRVCCVTLTVAGRELLGRIAGKYSRKTEHSLSQLSEEMRDILMASLRCFTRTFNDDE